MHVSGLMFFIKANNSLLLMFLGWGGGGAYHNSWSDCGCAHIPV